MHYKGGCFVGFFHPSDKNLPMEKCYIIANQHIHVVKETGSKAGCFAGFCHHSYIAWRP